MDNFLSYPVLWILSLWYGSEFQKSALNSLIWYSCRLGLILCEFFIILAYFLYPDPRGLSDQMNKISRNLKHLTLILATLVLKKMPAFCCLQSYILKL